MIDNVRRRIRRAVRAWRAARALRGYHAHTAAARKARCRYVDLLESAAPGTALVLYRPPTPNIARKAAAALGAQLTYRVSLTTITGGQRGKHAAPTALRGRERKAAALPRSTTRPCSAHRQAIAPTVRATVDAVGDLLAGRASRVIRRHYAPRSWGFDDHKTGEWAIA